ncbi:Uncharacterised protein [Acinetobacter baumannii]|nr:Uncharacterised protein [Acinetobacter baumannii]
MLMFETVVLAIKTGVLHAKGAGQIEHHAARRQESRCDIVADFMGGGEEHYIDALRRLGDVGQRLQRQIDDAFQLGMEIGKQLSCICTLR